MKKGFVETFAIYNSLVCNYSGVELSQLGNIYRQGAVYPVFMEIAYTQRTLNNIFEFLINSFTNQVVPYLQ